MKRMVKVLMGSIIALFVILVAIIVSYFVVENNGEKLNRDVLNLKSQGLYKIKDNDIEYDNNRGIYYVKNMLIIYFAPNVTNERKIEIVNSINGNMVGQLDEEAIQVRILENKSLEELENIIKKLEELEEVYGAMTDYIMQYSGNHSKTNDPGDEKEYKKRGLTSANWWLNAIQANEAWDYNNRFNNIKIGIVDDGFDTGHEDLEILFANDTNKAINNKDDHGTHVSGIIGATADNGKGIAGLVWNSELICYDWELTELQKFGWQNWLAESTIIDGLRETVKSGAKVINFSCGYDNSIFISNNDKISNTTLSEISKKFSKSIVCLLMNDYDFLIVQSSGNGASDNIGMNSLNNGAFSSITYENCYTNSKVTADDVLNRIIIVANAEQISNGYQITIDSNGGEYVDIAAPGQNIYSTITGGFTGSYGYMSGTSMAAPMVTGVASLVWSVNENFTGPEVKEIVCNNYSEWVASNPNSPNAKSDKINIKDGKEIYGYPMVNAKLAVEEAIRRTDNDTLIGVVEEETKSENQIEINDGESITLSGTLSFEDYEINSNNKGTALILTIEEPFTALFESGYTELITSVQLAFDEYSKFAKGQYITVTGKIMIAHTGHHRRSIVLTNIQNNINIAYQKITDEYSEAINKGYDYVLKNKDKYPNVNTLALFNNKNYPMQFFYCNYDIDNNGIDELLIGYDKDKIFDVYSFDDNNVLKALKLFKDETLAERSELIIFKNGVIKIHGSGGAEFGSENFYKFSDNGYTLNKIKEYIVDWELYPKTPYYNDHEFLTPKEFENMVKENGNKLDITKLKTFKLNSINSDDKTISEELKNNTLTNNKYQVINESMTWHEAKEYCEKLGGHLVTITSQEEQSFINSLLNEDKNLYWIGLVSNNNNWEWITGEDYKYTNWAKDEPNDDFNETEKVVQIYAKDHNNFYKGEWNDSRIDSGTMEFWQLTNVGFICEFENDITQNIELTKENVCIAINNYLSENWTGEYNYSIQEFDVFEYDDYFNTEIRWNGGGQPNTITGYSCKVDYDGKAYIYHFNSENDILESFNVYDYL